MAMANEILQEDIESSNKMIDGIKQKKSADQRVMDLISLLSTFGTYSVVNSSDARIPILFQCASENLENIK